MAGNGPQNPHGFKLCLRNCFSCLHNCAVTSFIRSKENYQLTSTAAQVRSTLVIVLRANSSEFKSCGPPIPTHNHIALESLFHVISNQELMVKLLFPLCLCMICCFEKVLGGGSDVLVNVCGWFVTIFSLVFSFSGFICRNKVENMTPLFGFILFWLNRKVY